MASELREIESAASTTGTSWDANSAFIWLDVIEVARMAEIARKGTPPGQVLYPTSDVRGVLRELYKGKLLPNI